MHTHIFIDMKLMSLYEDLYKDIPDLELVDILRTNFDSKSDHNFFVIGGTKMIVGHRIRSAEGFYDIFIPTTKSAGTINTTKYTLRKNNTYKAHPDYVAFRIDDIKKFPVVQI